MQNAIASSSASRQVSHPQISANAIKAVAVALGYLVCFLVGWHLKPADSPISFLWPPNSFLFGVLLLAPPRRWPLLLAGVLPVHLGIQLSGGTPILTSLSWYVSNCAEALIGAVLVRQFAGVDEILHTFRGALTFILFGVLTAPFITSFTDAGGVILTGYGHDFWKIWNERLFSNMASNVVFTPPILAIANAWNSRSFTVRKVVEGIAIACLSLAVVFAIFHAQLTLGEPLSLFLLLPLLLWAAVRFGTAGASTSLLVIALFTVWDTTHGHGPFVDRVRTLQVFFVILTMPFLCLGAVIEERRRVEQTALTNQRFSELISEISSGFVNLQWELIDEGISSALRRVQAFLRADRVSVFELMGSDRLALIYTVRSPGVGMPLPSVELEKLMVAAPGLKHGVAHLSFGDPESPAAVELLALAGAQSVMVVPVPGDNRLQGILTFACLHDRCLDAQEALLKVFGEVIFDAIQRKRAMQTLAESEQRFRHIADHTPVLVWMADADGLYTYVNTAWIHFTGLPSLQHDAAGWFRCIHPDDFERVNSGMEFARLRRAPLQIEYRFRRHDGEFRHILDTGVPRFSGDGSFLGYVGSAVDVTELKRAEELSSNFSGKLLLAQETERRRIARELHDDIGQRIALLAIELEKLREQGGTPATVAAKLLNDSKAIGASLRDLSHNLHSTGVEVLPLGTALRAICKDFNSGHPELHVTFSEEQVPPELPHDIKLCFYRITQECLQNVSKHSAATAVFLHLAASGENLRLTVIDNGVGFDVHKGASFGLGLRSMRERLRLLGGTFRVESQPGAGAKIEAHLSLTEQPFTSSDLDLEKTG
jgi:PAS domain S-box-containing protein